MTRHVFIPRNTPSSKNGKISTKIKSGPKAGKTIVINSGTVQTYKKATHTAWSLYKNVFKTMAMNHEAPYIVGLYFIRDSARIFDYINACQIVADLMQEYEWIQDDDTKNFKPLFLGEHIDVKNAGVYICLIKHQDLQPVINQYISLLPVNNSSL